MTGFVGTSMGIYEFHADNHTGMLVSIREFCVEKNAKYMSFHDGFLVTICESDELCGVAIYDENANLVARNLFEHVPSCYVTVINNFVYSANFHSGQVTKLCFPTLEIVNSATFGRGAGCHQIISCGNSLLVPCLNLDRIFVTDEQLTCKNELVFPQGSGPRHGIVHEDNLFIATELSDELYTFSTRDFSLKHRMSLFDKNAGGTAAIRMNEEKTLFISTREWDVLTAVDVAHSPKILHRIPCGGRHPRDIFVKGRFVFVANRDSDEFVGFLYDLAGFKQIFTAKIKGCVAVCMKGDLL